LNHNEENSLKKRNRGRQLNKIAVKYYAKKVGITCFEQFELRLFSDNPSLAIGSKVPKRAWFGEEKIEIKHIEKVSSLFNLADYTCLLEKPDEESAWNTLVSEKVCSEVFIELVEHSTESLNIVQFENSDKEGLRKILIGYDWHFEISGQKGEALFLLIQSEIEAIQLAPIERSGYPKKLTSKVARYPEQKSFNFALNKGVGWRRVIAIKGHNLPVSVKNKNSMYSCNLDELEILSRNLLSMDDESIMINTIEFEIVK